MGNKHSTPIIEKHYLNNENNKHILFNEKKKELRNRGKSLDILTSYLKSVEI